MILGFFGDWLPGISAEAERIPEKATATSAAHRGKNLDAGFKPYQSTL
jgi:hypothetical protein